MAAASFRRAQQLLPMHMEHGAGFGSQRSAGDLQGAFWTEACQLEMAAGFLRDITVDGTHDPSRNYGGVAPPCANPSGAMPWSQLNQAVNC